MTVAQGNTHNPALAGGVAFGEQAGSVSLDHREVGAGPHQIHHRCLIEVFIGLGPGSLNSGAFAAVQNTELNPGLIDDAAHHAAQGIDLANEMSLTESADGWIAWHPADF